MMRMSDAQQFYVVGIHGAPTPETAPHGFRWRAATGQRWFYGDFADIPANANDQWAPLPAPPTEEAPAPEPVKRWTVDESPAMTDGRLICAGNSYLPIKQAHAAADALNALDRDGVVWGPGRPMSELPETGRVLVRLKDGLIIARANTIQAGDFVCWWPLPGEAT